MGDYSEIEDCLYIVPGASSVGGVYGGYQLAPASLRNNYFICNIPGAVNGSDQDGAHRARTVTLGDNVGLVGAETAYNVSGLTAIGTTALRCGSTIYSGEDQTLTLNYSGDVPDGYNAIKYNVTSGDGQTEKNGYGLVEGYTFQMPAADMIASVNNTNDLALILLDDDSARPAGKKNADYIALGGSGKKVILQGRKLYQDGEWNTICLPFSLDQYDLYSTSLAGATLMELDVTGTYDGDKQTGFDASASTLNLYFKSASSITAGTPYIIKWGNREGQAGYLGTTIVSPLFNSIDISSANPTTVMSADGKVSFVGTYGATAYTTTNTSVLFLGSGNKIYYPQIGASIGALRAYFTLDGITAGNPANSIKMFFGDEQTGVTTPLAPWRGVGGEAWYTIDGRRLSGKPTQRGIYVNNGQKIIIN